MVRKDKARCLPKGVKDMLVVNIQKELSILQKEDGYSSAQLGRLLKRVGVVDNETVTKEELLSLLKLFA